MTHSEPFVSRRTVLAELLEKEAGNTPVSASVLAARLGVSRQVIVGDIALLRTAGLRIDATPRGYVLHREKEEGIRRPVVCCHSAADTERELCAVVDVGCTVCDVTVEHPVYGRLTGELNIASRYDAAAFLKKVADADALPLSALTEGVHIHTLLCPSEEAYGRAVQALAALGFLRT